MTVNVSVASGGVLARGGSALVHTLVYHHPTPQTPPVWFEDLADPIFDADGKILDWQLSLGKLLAHRDEHVHDVWTTFATWRRTFVLDRLAGDRATVRAFLHWGDRVTDVSTLHAINLDTACIEAKVAPRVAWQVAQAETVCRQRGELGLGVSIPQQPGLVRGFVVEDEPLLVLGDRDARVSAVRSGLVVHDPALPDVPPDLLVHGWVVEPDGVTAISDEGPVSLGSSSGGRLLAQVAPGVSHASVGPAPLTSVFSVLFLALHDAAQLACLDRVPLYVRTGPARY